MYVGTEHCIKKSPLRDVGQLLVVGNVQKITGTGSRLSPSGAVVSAAMNEGVEMELSRADPAVFHLH